MIRVKRFALTTLLVAGSFCVLAPTAQAGLFGKLKKKVDRVSEKTDRATAKADAASGKVTQPIDDAQGQIDEATGKVTQPFDEAQSRIDETTGEAMQPFEKAQSKVSETTGRITQPVANARSKMNGARSKVSGATYRATAPVRRVQGAAFNVRGQATRIQQTPAQMSAQMRGRAMAAKNQAMQPVVQGRQTIDTMRAQPANLKYQLQSAARLTDTAFSRDAILNRARVDAIPSFDGKSLKLVGTVSSLSDKMRAQQIAARNYKNVVNEIRVMPRAQAARIKNSMR